MSPNPIKLPSTALVPPLGSDAVWAAGWTPAEARLAVDQFRRGSSFRWGWQLSLDAPGYPPIKSALEQRLATPCGLPWGVSGGARAAARVEAEAARLLFVQHLARLIRTTLRDLAMCGLSVWHHPLAVDPDTLRTEIAPYHPAAIADPTLVPPGVPVGGVQRWPLSAVGWTPYPVRGVMGYYAIAQGNQWIQLPRPGTTEGEWTVVGEGDMPHLDAAICSLDMPFTAGMLAMRARSNLGQSAGRASPIGYMPEDVPVHTPPDANGNAVQGPGEDAAETLAALGTEQTAALFPHGFKVDKFELTTTGAAEYFASDLRDLLMMVSLAVSGHAQALGKTDAQYQSQEGREVDVPEALTRRDVRAIERAADGIFAMLAEMNSGLPAEKAPKLEGHLPDADQAERVKAQQEQDQREAEKHAKAHAALYAERSNGFDFPPTPEGQARLDALFARFGCLAPKIPPQGLPPVIVKLPPTETTLTPETAVPKPPPAGDGAATPPPVAQPPAAP